MGDPTRIDEEIKRTWREGEASTTSATALADPDSADPDSDTTDSDSDSTDSSDADTSDSAS